MRFHSTLFLALAGLVRGDTHFMFSGFFSGSTVVGLEYDDAAGTLAVVKNVTIEAASSKWIAMDSRKKNLYVAAPGAFQSYSITSDLSLTYTGNITLPSACQNANHAVAALDAVYGAVFSIGCAGVAMAIDSSGSIVAQFGNATYDAAAGVHGQAVSPDGKFLYSADDSGNAVWTHAVDAEAGTVTEVQRLAAPTGADPRHLTVHPNGEKVYVVFEAGNGVGVYNRDNGTGELAFANETYSLLPEGYTNSSSYWADEVLLSVPSTTDASPKYLIAATRSRTANIAGWIAAFALDADTGAIAERLFLVPSTGSGGSANSVTPSSFDEAVFAITDSGENFVEVWQIDETAKTASAVAHVGLTSAPANVQWYS